MLPNFSGLSICKSQQCTRLANVSPVRNYNAQTEVGAFDLHDLPEEIQDRIITFTDGRVLGPTKDGTPARLAPMYRAALEQLQFLKRAIGFSRSWYARNALLALQLSTHTDPYMMNTGRIERLGRLLDHVGGTIQRGDPVRSVLPYVQKPPLADEDVERLVQAGMVERRDVRVQVNDLENVTIKLVQFTAPTRVFYRVTPTPPDTADDTWRPNLMDALKQARDGLVRSKLKEVPPVKAAPEYSDRLFVTRSIVHHDQVLRTARSRVLRFLQSYSGESAYVRAHNDDDDDDHAMLDMNEGESLAWRMRVKATTTPAIVEGRTVIMDISHGAILFGVENTLWLPIFETFKDCCYANGLNDVSSEVTWTVVADEALQVVETATLQHPFLKCPEQQNWRDFESEEYFDAQGSDPSDPSFTKSYILVAPKRIEAAGTAAFPAIVRFEVRDSRLYYKTHVTRYFYNSRDHIRGVMPCVTRV